MGTPGAPKRKSRKGDPCLLLFVGVVYRCFGLDRTSGGHKIFRKKSKNILKIFFGIFENIFWNIDSTAHDARPIIGAGALFLRPKTMSPFPVLMFISHFAIPPPSFLSFSFRRTAGRRTSARAAARAIPLFPFVPKRPPFYLIIPPLRPVGPGRLDLAGTQKKHQSERSEHHTKEEF